MSDRTEEFIYDYPNGVAIRRDKHYQYNDDYALKENKAWFEASEKGLVAFYREVNDFADRNEVKRNYFWANMSGKKRNLTHSGLPRNISQTMARILFHNGIIYDAGVRQKELESILKENNLYSLLSEGAMTESWGGRFAYKISFDPEISENVLIDLIEPGAFDVVFIRDRVQELRFYKSFEIQDVKFKLVERYGKGYILYELYDTTAKEPKQVPLSAAGLELENFFFDDRIILAGFKANKNSKGISDYHGLISEFNSYDEAISGMGLDLRKGGTKTYIPEVRLNTNPVTGVTVGLDDFDNEYTVLKDDMRQDANNEIKFQQPEIRTESFTKAADRYESIILSNVGLNKLTLALVENIASDAAYETRRQLENASIRTRKEKVQLWKPFLEEFFAIILKAQSLFRTQTSTEAIVEVAFNEYLQAPAVEYTVEQIATLLELELITKEQAISFMNFPKAKK